MQKNLPAKKLEYLSGTVRYVNEKEKVVGKIEMILCLRFFKASVTNSLSIIMAYSTNRCQVNVSFERLV